MKKICVIGSLNIDMTAQASRLPRVGETVLAENFTLLVGGGKGANQAVAASKLGADVQMVGLLGDQFYGERYAQVLADYGVKNDTVQVLSGKYPGIAYIAVDKDGNNMIFVSPGTNMEVTPSYIDTCWPVISQCDIFLLQQEIPCETNLHTMRRLKQLNGKHIIFDPAPAAGFTTECLPYVDIITPNETETAAISGIDPVDEPSCLAACTKLRSMGAKTIVLKAGKKGAYLYHGEIFSYIQGFSVNAVDTTAAGDSFNAGFAYGYSIGLPLTQCCLVGHAVAAISTTKVGAQSAMPDWDTLLAFLAQQQNKEHKELYHVLFSRNALSHAGN